jgi:hypothetical protein
MDIMQRVNQLFKQYDVKLKAVAQQIKMAEASLEDGTTIETDAESFAVGAAVFVTSPEGNQIPLPDGEYKLADGTKIVVAEGVIAELEAGASEEEAPVPAEMSGYVTRQEVEDLIVQALSGVVKERMAAIEQVRVEMATQKKAVAEKMAKQTPLSREQNVKPEPVDVKALKGIERVQALQTQFQ